MHSKVKLTKWVCTSQVVHSSDLIAEGKVRVLASPTASSHEMDGLATNAESTESTVSPAISLLFQPFKVHGRYGGR